MLSEMLLLLLKLVIVQKGRDREHGVVLISNWEQQIGPEKVWVAGSLNMVTFKQLPLWSSLHLSYSVGIRNKHSGAGIPSLNPCSTTYCCVSLGKLLISLCPNTDNSSTYLIKIKCLERGLAHGKHLNCNYNHDDFPWAARPQY